MPALVEHGDLGSERLALDAIECQRSRRRLARPEPTEPGGSGITAPFNAPAQGPPPWHVFHVEPRSAIVVSGTEPGV